MIKTLIYLVIFAVLGFSVYFFIFKKTDSPYSHNEAAFTVKDTAAVYKIFIATNDNESITAERKADGWILNKNMKALPSMVDLILGTVYNQEALYPVTKNAYDVTIKNLSSEGIKVELYDKNNNKITAFYVGGTSANGGGTDMLTEGAKMPYVVQTAGFSGDLRPRFSTKVSDWRDRTVFNIPAENIKNVSIQYTEHPLNSFVMSRTGDKFTITGDPSITTAVGPLNEARVKVYASYFTNINSEGYLNGLEGLDTIMKEAVKMSTIDIETVKGTKEHADIYWMPLNKRSKNKMMGNDVVPDAYDADRMYGVINNNKDTVLIQTHIFFRVLRKSYEFFEKDVPQPQQKPGVPKNVLMHR